MRVLQLPSRFPYYAPDPTIVGSDFVALVDDALRVFDVRGAEARVVHEVEGVAQLGVAAGADDLVALDRERAVTRWQRSVDRWVAAVRVNLPELPDGDVTVASATGRFAYVDGKRGYLVDFERERIVAQLTADFGTARPCFARLADGREVLFVAAQGYMSVQMIDPATGDALAGYDERASHDFCHVDFRLARGGSRLLTYGCVWACPYEVIVYDATPWTGMPGAVAIPADDFALPIVRREVGLKAAHVDDDMADLSSVALEHRDDSRVLVVRRIDLRDGRTISASAHVVPDVSEQRVHYARGHRVVVAGPRLQVVNAADDRVEDYGELRLGDRATTAVTRDGETLIVVDAASPASSGGPG